MRVTTLGDLGERQIVRGLLAPRYAGKTAFGDDCATVPMPVGQQLVVSTDPAPRPLAWELGLPQDYYDWGWLLAAINISDLAAAGASALGLLSSLTLPSDTTISDFERLLVGIDECCEYAGTSVIGGNLKEAVDGVARAEATALGATPGRPYSRSGASPGDALVAFGPTGSFWAAAYLVLFGRTEASDGPFITKALTRPLPQIRTGLALREQDLVLAATDASDGLYAAVCSLTTDKGLGADLRMAECSLSEWVLHASERLGISEARLALGFGDLQLVCAVSAGEVDKACAVADRLEVEHCVLGSVTDRSGEIRLDSELDRWRLMNNFDNERFSPNSEFTAGLEMYAHRLRTMPLYS